MSNCESTIKRFSDNCLHEKNRELEQTKRTSFVNQYRQLSLLRYKAEQEEK